MLGLLFNPFSAYIFCFFQIFSVLCSTFRIIIESTEIRWSISKKLINSHDWVKSIRIRSFSGPYFPALGLSVFTPNAGKYRPEKLRIKTLFTQCIVVSGTLPKIEDGAFPNASDSNQMKNYNSSWSPTIKYWLSQVILNRFIACKL